jgi:hypothetical protein
MNTYNEKPKVAADFTMAEENANIYSNPFHAFGHIVEGETLTALAECGETVEQFVRSYVKGCIDGWLIGNDCRASAKTVYKVWRSGDEFDMIVQYIKTKIS